MSADKFTWTEQDVQTGGVRIYTSIDEANRDARQKTLAVATEGGYDTAQSLPNSILCGKHSTAEVIEVFPNGSWQYRDSTEKQVVSHSGPNATFLRWFLESDAEVRNLFES